MCFFVDLILFLARMLFAFVFAYLGIDQLLHWDRSLEFFRNFSPTYPQLLLVSALVLQFLGAFSLFFGVKTRLGAAALLLYVITMAFLPISPTELTQTGHEKELLNVLQQALSVAGLLYVFAVGSGRISCDWLCCGRKGCGTCPSKSTHVEPPKNAP